MAGTKLSKMRDSLNSAFASEMDKAFMEQFGFESKTTFSIFSMRMVTSTGDVEMTDEHKAFCKAFGDGYAAAMVRVHD